MRLEIPITPEPNGSFRIPAGATIYGSRPAIGPDGKFYVVLDVELPQPPIEKPLGSGLGDESQ